MSGRCGRTVPVGNILVCDARRHVKHDNTALSVDVVSITKTAELLLTSSVPDVELDLAKILLLLSVCHHSRVCGSGGLYGGEAERVNLYSKSRNVLLLELASKMALNEGRLED
jgi:hypothetical protein